MKPQEGVREYACQTTIRSQYNSYFWSSVLSFKSVTFVMFPLYLILFHIVFLSPKKTFSYLSSCVSGMTFQTWLGPPMSQLGLTSKTFPRCATVYNILPALTTLLILCVKGIRIYDHNSEHTCNSLCERCRTRTSASRSMLTSMSSGEIQGCWSAKITARRDGNQR